MSNYAAWVRNGRIFFWEDIYNAIDVLRTYGYNSVEEAQREHLLNYNMERYRPLESGMKDVDKFVDRVWQAIENNEFVCVFWDYDADGITATAVMKRGLNYLGIENVDYIAPNRDTGYSIKMEYIDKYFHELDSQWLARPTLLITVDCGIKSGYDIDAIIQKYNTPDTPLDIIVTDHHLPPDDVSELPLLAVAVIDPHQVDCNYPFKEISGSFVALKCIEAMVDAWFRFFSWPDFAVIAKWIVDQKTTMEELQDIATIWLIADVMPIVWENKLLAQTTLPRFTISSNYAIRKWASEVVSYSYSAIQSADTDIVWYGIGPRINAANRVGHYTTPLDMLLSNNNHEINDLFELVENLNNKRKLMAGINKKEAVEVAYQNKLYENNIVIVADGDLPDGIIGLVAWALKEEFAKPAICIGGYKDGVYKWSCRSVNGVHILEDVIQPFADYLLWFGGHSWAAGFSIHEDNLWAFIQDLTAYCNECITIPEDAGAVYATWQIHDFKFINIDNIKTINLVWPFGKENEKPQFILSWVVARVEHFWQNNRNSKIYLRDENNVEVECLLKDSDRIFGYNSDEIREAFPVGSMATFLWNIDVTTYRNVSSRVLLVEDILAFE